MNFNTRKTNSAHNNQLASAKSCWIKNQCWVWAVTVLLLLPLLTQAFTQSQKVKIGVVVVPENPDDKSALQLAVQLQQQIIGQLQNNESSILSLNSKLSHVTSLQQAQRNGCQYLLFINLRMEKTGGRSARDAIGDAAGTVGSIGGVIDIFRRKGSATQKAESAGRAAENAAGRGNGAKSTLSASIEVQWTDVARKSSLNWNLNSAQTSQKGTISDLAQQTIELVNDKIGNQPFTESQDEDSRGTTDLEPHSQPTYNITAYPQSERTCEASVTRFLKRNSGIELGMSHSQVRRMLRVDSSDQATAFTVPGAAFGLNTDKITYSFIDNKIKVIIGQPHPTARLYRVGMDFKGSDVPPTEIFAQRMAEAIGIEAHWGKSSSFEHFRLPHLRQSCGRYSLHVARSLMAILDQSVLQAEETKREENKLEEKRRQEQKYNDWNPVNSSYSISTPSRVSNNQSRPSAQNNPLASRPDPESIPAGSEAQSSTSSCEIQIAQFLEREPDFRMGMTFDKAMSVRRRYSESGAANGTTSRYFSINRKAYGLNLTSVRYTFTDDYKISKYYPGDQGYCKQGQANCLLYKIRLRYYEGNRPGNLPDTTAFMKRLSATLGVDETWNRRSISPDKQSDLYDRKCSKYELEIQDGEFTITDISVLERLRQIDSEEKSKKQERLNKEKEQWRPSVSTQPDSRKTPPQLDNDHQEPISDERQSYPDIKGTVKSSVSQNKGADSCEMVITRFLNRNPNFRLGMSYPEFMRRKSGFISYADPEDQPSNPYQVGIIKRSFVPQSPTPRQTWSRQNQQPSIIVIQGNAYGLSNQSTSYHFAMTNDNKEMSILYKISLYWANVPHISILAKRMAEELKLDNEIERERLASGARLECGHFKVEIGQSTFTIQDTNLLKQAQEKLQRLRDMEKSNKKKQDESWRP